MKNLFETELLCYDSDKSKELEDMGLELDDTDKWMPFSFFIENVEGFKESNIVFNGENINGVTTIYMKSGQPFTIKTPYKEFKKKLTDDNDIMNAFDPQFQNLTTADYK